MKTNLLLLSLALAALQSCTANKANGEASQAQAPQTETPAPARGVQAGAQAPDFATKTLQGKDISLSQFRGKYVVLDFWGIWCKWCVKGIPEMKNYYAKYASKMEILSIDCRDEMDRLLEFVRENDMNWTHVMNGSKPQDDLCKLYEVKGFPTKVLIDPQGCIVDVFVGEVPEFYHKLDELFK